MNPSINYLFLTERHFLYSVTLSWLTLISVIQINYDWNSLWLNPEKIINWLCVISGYEKWTPTPPPLPPLSSISIAPIIMGVRFLLVVILTFVFVWFLCQESQELQSFMWVYLLHNLHTWLVSLLIENLKKCKDPAWTWDHTLYSKFKTKKGVADCHKRAVFTGISNITITAADWTSSPSAQPNIAWLKM